VIAKQDLLRIKAKALRLNIWFKVLSRTERAMIDLTIKCVARIRSHILEGAISSIIDKILKALESRFLSNAEKAGREIADKLGRIAQKWGNREASNWKRDKVFIRFLGINAVNQ